MISAGLHPGDVFLCSAVSDPWEERTDVLYKPPVCHVNYASPLAAVHE